MRTPRALLPILSSLLVAASCGGGAGAPATGIAPATPAQPGAPSGGSGSAQGPVRSIADAVSLGELRAREVDQVDDALTMATSVGLRYRARFVDGYPGLIEFTLNNTGSGWQEKFLLQIPPVPPTSPAPMLVVFHKFGASHGDVLNTTFLAETQARGWYCVAPLGARQKHFGSRESQINTRAALELVAHLFPIDRNRVYGAGFSMGGGALANYAARHVDPAGIRFAAICDHTGGVSLGHTWFNEPDDADLDDNVPTAGQNLEVPDVLESLFGGTPSAVPFEYQRCSTIDLDPIGNQIGPGTDFGRNLAHIPALLWIANADPLAYLGTQTYALDGYLQAQNAGHQITVVSGSVHSWSTLDETAVCDWLQTKTLQTPDSGSSLADEDGTWFHFGIEQDAAGAFTPFTWHIDAPTKLVEITQSANLRRVSVNAAGAGLALSGNVTVRLSTADATGDRVRLLGVAAQPIAVTRDGLAAGGTYDAFTQSFEIVETDAAQHDWVLTFP